MNLLWSYVYARRAALDACVDQLPVDRVRFFADSGAHSARTLGVHLDVDTYAQWLQKWHPLFTVYASLDVIGAPQATWDNQRRLEDYGLSPMPVFHTGEPWSALERYLDAGYTYIALGKLLGNPVKLLRPWLAKAFRIAGDTAVFHGFGLTTWELLREFPFYSVDSSSWGSGFRYGSLRLFHRGRWVTVKLRDHASVKRHRHVLDAYNLPYAAVSKTHYDRHLVAGAAAASVYRATVWLQHRHGVIELPDGKGYPRGPWARKATPPVSAPLTCYLADTTIYHHMNHAKGLRRCGIAA